MDDLKPCPFCRRAAKLCVETGTIGELKFRLERDQ